MTANFSSLKTQFIIPQGGVNKAQLGGSCLKPFCSCSQMAAGLESSRFAWAHSASELIHIAGHQLGAWQRLSSGVPTRAFTTQAGLLTAWQLGCKRKCPKTKCFKSCAEATKLLMMQSHKSQDVPSAMFIDQESH